MSWLTALFDRKQLVSLYTSLSSYSLEIFLKGLLKLMWWSLVSRVWDSDSELKTRTQDSELGLKTWIQDSNSELGLRTWTPDSKLGTQTQKSDSGLIPLSDAAVSSLHAGLNINGVIAQSSQLQSLIQGTNDEQSIMSLYHRNTNTTMTLQIRAHSMSHSITWYQT